MGRDVTSRGVAWRETTRRDVMCHGVPFLLPGERFCRAGFRRLGTSWHNNGWGNLDRAGGTFFLCWIWKHKEILHNGGGTRIGPGELFSCAGFQNYGDLLHDGAWGNLARAGGTVFRGWISKQWGFASWRWGNLARAGGTFFSGNQLSNTNEG